MIRPSFVWPLPLLFYDSIIEKEWMPDFTSWEHDEFRWALPDRLLSEFAPSFWEQDEV